MHTRGIFVCIITCCGILTTSAQQFSQSNPLLVHSNTPIQYNKINTLFIREAASAIIALSEERIKRIKAVPAGQHNLSNTLMAFDELLYDVTDMYFKLRLISSTYADDSLRNTGRIESNKVLQYRTSLYLNEDLYQALRRFDATPSSKKIQSNHKKFLNETIMLFEKNGMKLETSERKTLEEINKKIAAFGAQFDKNLSESKDSIEFSSDELRGVLESTSSGWKRINGKHIIYVNNPNFNAILKYAENSNTRQRMYLHYHKRGYPQNLQVLDSLFYYRQLLAKTLGFKSFAEYTLVDKMAATPENVWKFENELIQKLTPRVSSELSELKALKRKIHPELRDSIYAWDVDFYQNKLLNTKYQLNSNEVKQFFEMNNTVRGMFNVFERLFKIQIKEVKNLPVWDEKVKSYVMYKEGKQIGSFYFDLYPRPNKFVHFACFPLSQYRLKSGKEILPVSALICNFPEGNPSQPSLLEHSNVITLFHEFGHLVHSMLARSDIASQRPFFFGMKRDFVEAPSQFLENWCWEYPALQMFARHYQTGQVLPRHLFDKIKQTQLVGSGIYYITQLYYGILDFTYADRYDSIKGQSLTKVSKDLHSITQVPFVEGSHFICGFVHLNSMAALYYGYMWSKVFAQDMYSAFERNGVMNSKAGVRYRKEVLEKSSTMEEMELLRNFLGREPNTNAFLRSLGIL